MSGITLALLLLLTATPRQSASHADVSNSERQLIEQIDKSGRCATIGQVPEKASQRRLIAPGQPPVLSFKYYQDARHHRFGNFDVVLDDAGH